MKTGCKVTYSLIFIGSVAHAGNPKTFCQAKFGGSVSIRFIPADANGGIKVEDGMLGSKVTETKPKVSPIGFVCVIAPSTEEQDCRKNMKMNRMTFKSTYCVSEVFSLQKLCPKEVLNYSDVITTEICKKK